MSSPPTGSDEHFVAHLKIENVRRRSTTDNPNTFRADPSDNKRKIEEVTQLTIKAPTLASLIAKLEAHVQVIGDLD